MGQRLARHFNLRSPAGYAFAVAALFWVFHDVELKAMTTLLHGLGTAWLIPAVASDVLSYVCQGERWRLLLRPTGNIPLRKAVQAIYAGLFTNEVAPLRFGEVVRAYLAAKTMHRPVSQVIPSMALERLMDSFWVAAGTGALVMFVPLPPDFAKGAVAFGVSIAVAVVLFVVFVLRPPAFVKRWSECRTSKIRSFIGGVLAGICRIKINREFAAPVFFSLGLLLFQAAAFWFVMVACRLPLGYAAAAAVFLIVRLGTALPNAPANVGAFQFFTVVGLQLFGIDKGTAAAFSVVVFLVLTLPLWILGLLAISNTGLSIAEIRADVDPSRRREVNTPERFPRVERAWPQQPF